MVDWQVSIPSFLLCSEHCETGRWVNAGRQKEGTVSRTKYLSLGTTSVAVLERGPEKLH